MVKQFILESIHSNCEVKKGNRLPLIHKRYRPPMQVSLDILLKLNNFDAPILHFSFNENFNEKVLFKCSIY
jgi:hypothetical protein